MELMHLENFNAAEFLHCLLFTTAFVLPLRVGTVLLVQIEIISLIIAPINYLNMNNVHSVIFFASF